jgi:hypothetical protein
MDFRRQAFIHIQRIQMRTSLPRRELYGLQEYKRGILGEKSAQKRELLKHGDSAHQFSSHIKKPLMGPECDSVWP